MATEYTKGPWTYDENFPTSIWANNVWLASTNVGSLRTPEETAANARLIAASPEMLATLKSMRSTLLKLGGDPMPTLDAVIAKAEGK